MSDYQHTIDAIFDSAEEDKQRYLANPNIQFTPGRVFANPNHQHAAQVISKLVNVTKRELVILCRKLGAPAHSALRLEAHLARNPDVRVRVLIESDRDNGIDPDGKIRWHSLQGSALSDFRHDHSVERTAAIALDGNARNGQIAVRVMPIRSPVHFIVSDEFAYRIEEDDVCGRAYVNAKDPGTSYKLIAKFEPLWANAVPVDYSVQVAA